MPKAGTNLLSRALFLHPQLARQFRRTAVNMSSELLLNEVRRLRSGKFLLSHLRYDAELDVVINQCDAVMWCWSAT